MTDEQADSFRVIILGALLRTHGSIEFLAEDLKDEMAAEFDYGFEISPVGDGKLSLSKTEGSK